MPLRVVTTDPFNAEAPLSALGAPLTPVAEFYIRNNFAMPQVNVASWRLRLHGRVREPLELELHQLMALPAETRRVTLECAGNGRALLDRTVPGTPWGLGAAGTAEFTGVSLHHVLGRAGLDDDVVECLFTGADAGEIAGRGRIHFQRSLPAAVACGPAPLLAWAMNGAALAPGHGYPLRLVVPGWYAVASVKWLTDIEALARPFDGHFQTDRYVYRGGAERAGDQPVTLMRVRALITSHEDGATVPAGTVRIAGVAWSGAGGIRRVEVGVEAVGGGGSWHEAELAATAGAAAGAATRWACGLTLPPGSYLVRARATDETGATQPDDPAWNELGYGNNVVQAMRLVIVA
jgi:DMSO/TMAO reductase YedYZ molybdopterin-dependent catalytic subunit